MSDLTVIKTRKPAYIGLTNHSSIKPADLNLDHVLTGDFPAVMDPGLAAILTNATRRKYWSARVDPDRSPYLTPARASPILVSYYGILGWVETSMTNHTTGVITAIPGAWTAFFCKWIFPMQYHIIGPLRNQRAQITVPFLLRSYAWIYEEPRLEDLLGQTTQKLVEMDAILDGQRQLEYPHPYVHLVQQGLPRELFQDFFTQRT
ncbi:MAG: hypothetical protein ABIG95_06680 [Candidatus Woesearchaeota archaeon]